MNQDDLKKRVAYEAINYIKDGMVVGLGTGSTMYYAIQSLGERIKEGLNIKGIPTSEKTAEWARSNNIPLTDFSEVNHLDLVIDGADEVDENFQLIKGGGGALLREKIVANATDQFIVIIDESKYVQILGEFKLPVEVVPFGWEVTAREIEALGCNATLRMDNNGIFLTDNDHYILDCDFKVINNPEKLNQDLISIVGVVETGLFINMTRKVLISYSNSGKVIEMNN
ncbi:ribose-5-phosphate isomerase RpiA [Mammaliicoccus fleurettii]|uniref:Ribose-5-phosphate isomerase A n=1 Tax=Mammaliicoccus fleurettii TaxID=150056 RepID=A0ABS5MP00_9STAP|nr:ribose-5-phosphate isomerase RpiA [Mammaliicoccus fleurettii]MBS3671943.1 ribose-5-phosphate isomerase RpiA [Mammaliicoccus fleurettii]MBS3697602.1 ribose-5-phosphate isomerase RpiA [Mammaliicoccus fleurettii]